MKDIGLPDGFHWPNQQPGSAEATEKIVRSQEFRDLVSILEKHPDIERVQMQVGINDVILMPATYRCEVINYPDRRDYRVQIWPTTTHMAGRGYASSGDFPKPKITIENDIIKMKDVGLPEGFHWIDQHPDSAEATDKVVRSQEFRDLVSILEKYPDIKRVQMQVDMYGCEVANIPGGSDYYVSIRPTTIHLVNTAHESVGGFPKPRK